MLQSFSKIIVVSNYLLNKQEITLRYCENKAKPALRCQGMCHLKKQLAEENAKNSQSRSPGSELGEVVLFQVETESLIKFPFVTKLHNYPACPGVETTSYTNAIFHPPSVNRGFYRMSTRPC
ncbi:MAG: hypothetical protein JNK73_12290 [Bacteroidia bacterium]|nr:hypothetical protein [Bacteroidia bacterium]